MPVGRRYVCDMSGVCPEPSNETRRLHATALGDPFGPHELVLHLGESGLGGGEPRPVLLELGEMQRILDQMSQWESFVDVVNQLRHVITAQENIRQSTEQTQKKQIKGVFDDE